MGCFDVLGQVNYLAVLACTVVAMILGSLWYSPVLFGNAWMKAIGLKKEDFKKGDSNKAMFASVILAFIGAIQLMMFGAQIYVADLVGIAMVRVMGAVMVGIVMAGRTGAAFAAQLGTMQGNEEIDALKTMGVSPMEFLVLPRMLALVLMMPLLCVYADLMGVLGGLIVGVSALDIGLLQYINQTTGALKLSYFFIGIIHAIIFGVLVSLAGCLRGIQCGRSASAVGDATTSAVVTSIVAIIVATGIITVVCNMLGI